MSLLSDEALLLSDEESVRRSPSDISIESQSNQNTSKNITTNVGGNLLDNLIGLSTSPYLSSHCRSYSDDQSSIKDSIMSSLSSHSLDNYSILAASNKQQYDNKASNINYTDDSMEKDNLLYKTDNNNTVTQSQVNYIYDELFLIQNNKYYKGQVKVKSTLPRNLNVFKDKTRLIQTINFHSGAIWTMKFSPSGAFLCTAGQDTNIIVWSIGSHPLYSIESSLDHLNELTGSSEHTNHPKDFIYPEPYRIFQGHTGDIIDVAWSKSNFILSASTDKTVCLWHVSRADCLQFFRHPDIVTAVEFHPAHDRYYISGCFDRKIRVWDIIPDGVVLEWTQTTDTITSLCFSPNGKTVLGGLIHGKVFFYDLIDFDQLKYKTQMNCRNHSGKYSKGTKVTGLAFLPSAYKNNNNNNKNQLSVSNINTELDEDENTIPYIQNKLLVTTNDSRIRLCRLDDYSLQCKYKGLHNKSMQIKATFSNDGKYVISGSETGEVLIWSTKYKNLNLLSYLRKMGTNSNRNDGYESFQCTSYPDCANTVAVFASSNSLFLHLKNNLHLPSLRYYKESELHNNVSSSSNNNNNHKSDSNSTNVTETNYASAEHMLDNHSRIIVTADYDGVIRVFFRLK